MGYVRLILAWGLLGFAFSALSTQLDPFDPQATVPKGRFTGNRIESHQRRSIVLLSRAERERYTGMDHGYAFANFSHDGTFCIAWLAEDSVDTVIFQTEYFPAIIPAAHTLLRFKLKKTRGARVFAQPGNRPPSEKLVQDVIFSAEAVHIEGGPEYDVIKGLNNAYGLALRFASLEEKYEYMVRKQNHEVRQYVLSIDDEQKQQLLEAALQRSHLAGMKEMYNTITKSCTTEVFDLLDSVLLMKPIHPVVYLLDRIPTHAFYYLKWRRLLDPIDEGDYPNLDEEWILREEGIECHQVLLNESDNHSTRSNPSDSIRA